jgi:hypothetical protein
MTVLPRRFSNGLVKCFDCRQRRVIDPAAETLTPRHRGEPVHVTERASEAVIPLNVTQEVK